MQRAPAASLSVQQNLFERKSMKRRELLKALPALTVAAQAAKVEAQTQAAYRGRLRPGVVAMSFRPQLESGRMTYEDAVRQAADLGLEGMDLTSYWVPPLLNFKSGIRSQEISEMVRQSPANPTSQWLASLRKTAYQNGVQIYSVGSPVKMAQPTPELRQKEIAFAKKWVDIADHLGAGHVRLRRRNSQRRYGGASSRLGHRSLQAGS
jgi:hypothetical protein